MGGHVDDNDDMVGMVDMVCGLIDLGLSRWE